MSEAKSAMVAAIAACIAAIVAVIALPMSSCHHSQILTASNDANKQTLETMRAAIEQAQTEHTAQIDQFIAERKGWEDTLAASDRDRIERAEQFKEQLRVARESAAEQQAQWKISLDNQKLQWNNERVERRAIRYEEFKPRIAPLQCCNYQVGIKPIQPIERSPAPIIPSASLRLPRSTREIDEFPEHYIAGYVVKLVNLGGGAAENLVVCWYVSSIVYSEGEKTWSASVSETENAHWWRSCSFTTPNHVRPADEAEVRHLPQCLHDDERKIIQRVDGYVEFACYHMFAGPLDRPILVQYDFSMRPVYDPEPMDGIQDPPPFIHVHIGELRKIEPVGVDYMTPHEEPSLPQELLVPSDNPSPERTLLNKPEPTIPGNSN